MFKKILNVLLIFSGFVLLTVLSIVVCLKAVFTEERLKKLSGDAIRGFVYREASFGRFRWGIAGIEIEDFALSEIPDFKAGTFITAKRVAIRPGFLQGKTRGGLVIDSPKVFVFQAHSSGWNFSDIRSLFSKSGSSGGHYRYGYFPFSTGMRVKNGEIIFTGKGRGAPLSAIENIDLAAVRAASDGVFNVVLKADIVSRGERMSLDAKSSFVPDDDVVKVYGSQVGEGRKFISISGQLNKLFTGEKIGYDLDIEGDRIVLDKILKLVSAGSGDIQFGERQQIYLHITGDADAVRVTEKK